MNTRAERIKEFEYSGLVTSSKARMLKRVFDIFFSVLALFFVWPIMVAAAIAIKCTSRGPIFFKQRREGLNGKIFSIYKFRSMKVHEEKTGEVTQAKKNDNRITAVGGFLRKTSLDELPQFINVLKGDMSVVGPRPHAIEHNKYYRERIHNYDYRHIVNPGLTGWAQINGHRGETETEDKMAARIEHDLWYVKNASLLLDIKIIIKTPFSLFFNEAY